jgi:hypothetical protein
MSATSTTLVPLFAFLAQSLNALESGFSQIPGSAVFLRYVKSSHQNDPGRSVLELILVVFAFWTLLQSRTRADRTGKHFIQFNDKVCKPSGDGVQRKLTGFFRKLTSWSMNGRQNLSGNPSMLKSRQSWPQCL